MSLPVCQDSVKTLEREMWRRSTEHNVDIDKWIRDDIQTRALVQFSSSSSRPKASRMMVSSGQQNTRCSDPVCRLPCSLQPLEPGHPRPRLETEADWARARQEVEARRERGRREEAAMVKYNANNNKTKYLGSDGAF